MSKKDRMRLYESKEYYNIREVINDAVEENPERTKSLSDNLTKAGINNIYYESPGTAHEFLTWRRCLNEFAPLLFK